MAKLAMVVFAMAAMTMMALQGADAATYVVGDAVGWRVPPTSTTYSNWSSAYAFQVGDVLLFNYVTGAHDVAEVTQANYDACEDDSPITLITSGPTSFPLNETKTYYFICTIGDHCESSQKVSVTVGSSTGSTPSPSASPGPSTPTTNTTTPPPDSGAISLKATSRFFLVPLAMVMSFMWM